MEQTLTRTETISKEVVIQGAIAVSVAAVYFLLAKINPATAFIGASALSFASAIRLTNLLRPLVIRYYGAAFGIAAGSHLVNVSSGKVALFGYSIMPVIMLGVGLCFYGLSKAWGRSTAKDLTLIAAYGAIAGLIVSLNLVSVAILFNGSVWSKLLKEAVQMRILMHTIISLAGYPVLRAIEGITDEKNTCS